MKAALIVWKTEARKRNKDTEDKCTAKSTMNWWKNLKPQHMIKESQIREFEISAAPNIPDIESEP